MPFDHRHHSTKLRTDSAPKICLFNVPILATDSAKSDWNLIQDLQQCCEGGKCSTYHQKSHLNPFSRVYKHQNIVQPYKHVSLSTQYHSPQAKSARYVKSSIHRKKAIWQPLYKRLTPNAAAVACSCRQLPLCSHLQVAYCHGSIRQRKRHAPQSNYSHVARWNIFWWYTLGLACDAQQPFKLKIK